MSLKINIGSLQSRNTHHKMIFGGLDVFKKLQIRKQFLYFWDLILPYIASAHRETCISGLERLEGAVEPVVYGN